MSNHQKAQVKLYGHTSSHDTLAKTLMKGTFNGGRRRGRQRKSWADNIKKWTRMSTPELLRVTPDRHHTMTTDS